MSSALAANILRFGGLALLCGALLSSVRGVEATTPTKKKPSTAADATPRPKRKAAATEDSDSTPKAKAKSDLPSGTPRLATPREETGDATPKPRRKGASQPAEEAASATPKASGKATPSANAAPAEGGEARTSQTTSSPGPNATLDPADLVEFSSQPGPVQQLLTAALGLTKQNLTYTYGSAEPSNGGMDCSGTIYYLLRQAGFKDVPRDASGQYVWGRKNGEFFAVVGKKADSFEFSDLLPGDLLFWSGTYNVERDPPVTHSMIYLGTEKRRKQRVMVGSSDGRTYDGKSRWGVSVFDFVMPRTRTDTAKAQTDFLGYARIPGLRRELAKSDAGAIKEASSEKTSEPEQAKSAPSTPRKKRDEPESSPRPKTRKKAP